MNKIYNMIRNKIYIYIPKIIASAIDTEEGIVGQRKDPTTRGRTNVTRSSPFFSANSSAVLSVMVLESR